MLFPLGGMIWSVEMLCLFLIIFCTYKKMSAFNRFSIFMYVVVRVVMGFNSFIYTTFWEIVVQCSPVHQLFIEINLEIKQIWIHMLSDCLDTVNIKIEFEFNWSESPLEKLFRDILNVFINDNYTTYIFDFFLDDYLIRINEGLIFWL